MNTRNTLIALTIVAGLLLAGCVPVPSASSGSLADTSWLLVNLNGQPALSDTQVTIRFENGQLSGSDGCNRYSGSYTINGARITVDKNLISTMMACAEPIMTQAAAYIAALTGAATYTIEGGQLTLLDGSGKALATFTRQSVGLSGTAWVVTGYNNGQQAVVSVAAGSQLTANFGADGTLSGSAGCNTFTATYEVSGKTVKIGPIGSTRMACADPAGVMEQEAQYLGALATAATYTREGNQLELRTADGALAASFVLAN